MEQIFKFIIKNINKILFLLLLFASLALTIQFHSYHKSKLFSSANAFTGSIYKKFSSFKDYLTLEKENKSLIDENVKLKNYILAVSKHKNPKILDSIKGFSQKNLIIARVINNSYNVQENYLTLSSGAKDGIRPDMGVINSLGIVGIIDKTSLNYSTVMSILNTKSQINAKVKGTNHFGSLRWDGKSSSYVQLEDIPRLAKIKKGDTIVTGSQSDIFPENTDIGIVEKIFTSKESSMYSIDIKLFNDMTNLGYIYVIKSKNKNSDELKKLEGRKENE